MRDSTAGGSMTDDEAEKKLNAWLTPLRGSTQTGYRQSVGLLAQSLGGSEADAVRLIAEGDPATARAAVENLELLVREAGHAAASARRHGTALSSLAKFLGRDLGLRGAVGRPSGPRAAGPPDDAGYVYRRAQLGSAADLVDALLARLPALAALAGKMRLTVGEALVELLQRSLGETAHQSRQVRAVMREAAVLASDEIRDRGHRRPPPRAKGDRSASSTTPKAARVMSEYEIDKFIVGPELERQAAERAAREVDPCSN